MRRRDFPGWILLDLLSVCLVLLIQRALQPVAPRPIPNQLRGGELVMVFVVSGICGATAQEGFDEAYAEVETVLSSQANGEGLKLHTIGIAVDPLVEDGLAVLRRFGPFDEILAGAGWENGMSLHYLFGDLSVLPTVPQLLVFRRSVVPENRTLLIMQDTLLFALRGLEEIVHFSQHGLPPGRQSQ